MSKSPLTAKYGLTVRDATDTTKAVSIDVSGVTTGTTRTLKVQDTDAVLASVQDIQNAAADKPSFDFASTRSITATFGPSTNIRTSDYTSITTFLIRNFVDIYLFSCQTGNPFVDEGISAAGKFYMNDGVVPSQNDVRSNATLVSGRIYTATAMRSGTDRKIYLNGVLDKLSTGNTVYDVNLSGTPTASLGGITTPGYSLDGQLFRHLRFNYSLSDAKRNYYEAGGKLLSEDVGGSMVNLVTGWTNNTFGTLTSSGSNISSLVGVSGAYGHSDTIPIVAGVAYRFTITVSGSAISGLRVRLMDSGWAVNKSNIVNLVAGQQTITLVATATDATANLLIESFGAAANCAVTFSNPLGALVAYEPETCNNSTWPDSSGNLLHGTVSGAVAQNVNYRGGHVPVSASDVVPAGCVGELKESYTTSNFVDNVAADGASVSLTAGIWDVTVSGEIDGTGGVVIDAVTSTLYVNGVAGTQYGKDLNVWQTSLVFGANKRIPIPGLLTRVIVPFGSTYVVKNTLLIRTGSAGQTELNVRNYLKAVRSA